MGANLLVDGLIEDTKLLIKNLDKLKRSCSLVVWYYYPDSTEWKLLLAGKWLDDLLPNQEAIAYQKIAQTINELSLRNLLVSHVRLLRHNNMLIDAIATITTKDFHTLTPMHLTSNSLNGIYIDEMLIMRSSPATAAA